jgi:glycosyltransferase involved in cell wall biosynthesis
MKPLFTVFSPTYNRAHTLPRVYESLKQQTFRGFEWLIVDDGSTDNTRELVAAWQEESKFPIRYFWQKNEHKKVAFNRGVREAQGELFLTWDSDDEAVPEALEILARHWQSIPPNKKEMFSGVTGLCVDGKGKIVGSRFPTDVIDSDSLEIRYRYRVSGEKWGFQRTDVMRQFPFPENAIGHVPEGVIWSALAKRYKTRFVNDILRVYHAEGDSIMQTGISSGGAKKNADGHALWAREVLCNEMRWFFYSPIWFLKMAANFTRFQMHLRRGQPGKRWQLNGVIPRLLVTFMWPVGCARYLTDLVRETGQR